MQFDNFFSSSNIELCPIDIPVISLNQIKSNQIKSNLNDQGAEPGNRGNIHSESIAEFNSMMIIVMVNS